MNYLFFIFLLSVGLCFSDALCGEYEMEDDMCFYFSCDDRENNDNCLPVSSSYFPDYFTSFRASIRFQEDYKYCVRLTVFAYDYCEMPIWDIELYSYKPLLRNSTIFGNGTYIDAVFNKVDMTPLRENLEYDQSLDCKVALHKNQTFEVTGMNPEYQMCMYEMGSASIDLFTFVRQLVGFSISLDVMWLDEDTITVTNELIDLVGSILPMTSLNMMRYGSDECVPLKY